MNSCVWEWSQGIMVRIPDVCRKMFQYEVLQIPGLLLAFWWSYLDTQNNSKDHLSFLLENSLLVLCIFFLNPVLWGPAVPWTLYMVKNGFELCFPVSTSYVLELEMCTMVHGLLLHISQWTWNTVTFLWLWVLPLEVINTEEKSMKAQVSTWIRSRALLRCYKY